MILIGVVYRSTITGNFTPAAINLDKLVWAQPKFLDDMENSPACIRIEGEVGHWELDETWEEFRKRLAEFTMLPVITKEEPS